MPSTPADRAITATRQATTTYAVVAVQRIRKADLSPDEVFSRSGRPVLRLITCGGTYDPSRGGYQDNLVVTAERR